MLWTFGINQRTTRNTPQHTRTYLFHPPPLRQINNCNPTYLHIYSYNILCSILFSSPRSSWYDFVEACVQTKSGSKSAASYLQPLLPWQCGQKESIITARRMDTSRPFMVRCDVRWSIHDKVKKIWKTTELCTVRSSRGWQDLTIHQYFGSRLPTSPTCISVRKTDCTTTLFQK